MIFGPKWYFKAPKAAADGVIFGLAWHGPEVPSSGARWWEGKLTGLVCCKIVLQGVIVTYFHLNVRSGHADEAVYHTPGTHLWRASVQS